MQDRPLDDIRQSSIELLSASASGDTTALETLLVRHLSDLRAFVRLRMGPQLREQESCSDLVQSVCREILENPDRFEHQGDVAFRSWLYGAVLHKIQNRGRYYHSAKRDPARVRPADNPDQMLDLKRSYGAFLSPSAAAIAHEEIDRLEEAFDHLTEEQQLVLSLHRFVGMSHKQIGEHCNKSESAVRMIMHRALAHLTSMLVDSKPNSGA